MTDPASLPELPAAPSPSIFRHRAFTLFWVAEVLAMLGGQAEGIERDLDGWSQRCYPTDDGMVGVPDVSGANIEWPDGGEGNSISKLRVRGREGRTQSQGDVGACLESRWLRRRLGGVLCAGWGGDCRDQKKQ